MAQVKFKYGLLANIGSLSVDDGQFIVARDAATNRAEIYVDTGTGASATRLRVGDFEAYDTLSDLQTADPSHNKLYYVKQNNLLAVWDAQAASGSGAFVQVNDGGIQDITVTGAGNVVSSASFDASTGVLTLTKGITALESADVATAISTAIQALDTTNDVTIASESNGVVTIKAGISETDGIIGAGSGSDITLAKVATTGDADDVEYTTGVSVKDALDTLNGSDSTTGSVAKAVKDAVDGLDVTEFALAEKASGTGVVTIHGAKEVDGKISVGTTAANDVVLAAVAGTGAASDVSYSQTIGAQTVTNVDDALDALVTQTAGGVASKTVYITETSGGSGDAFSKKYGIYQGATGSASSPVAGEKLADIDIPKDMVVEDGSVVDVVFDSSDNTLHEGSISGTDVTAEIKGTGTATAADAGKYIKLVIANATSNHLWIKATDLVDIYTVEQSATQIQLAIDNNNVISATIVAGSVGATELDSTVNASLAKADSAVQSITTGTANGTIEVDGTDVAVAGLGSAAFADTTAFDASGAASTAAAGVVGQSGDTASDDTVYGAKAYADAAADDALSDAIGTSGDAASADTIYGAKAYADAAATAALTWGTF